ncbi:hypothetical protein DFP73DRAFT_487712 [Morchella snyderi]|nr:hypothetical protein DFP73DRAFT_487712 [Morchella snyderi]
MSVNSNDIVIAVMGITGVRKSSFIKLVTGDNSIVVGNSLTSETSKVTPYRLLYKGLRLVLIDTPALDDSDKHNRDVFEIVSNWLESNYPIGFKLNGIICLHRIIDPRVNGSTIRSLRMLKRLSGYEYCNNVLLGMTFWSHMAGDPELGNKRELELCEGPWASMIGEGSKAGRIPYRDQTLALELLHQLAARLELNELEKYRLNAELELYSIMQDIERTRIQIETTTRELQRELMEDEEKTERLEEELVEQANELRSDKMYHFNIEIQNSLEQLEVGKHRGDVICRFRPTLSCYNRWCNNCFNSIGTGVYYCMLTSLLKDIY